MDEISDGDLTLFRADKRVFNVGHVITSAFEYHDRCSGLAQLVEQALEKCRPPDRTERRRCLFLFESLDAARKHWSKMSGGKLYACSISANAILHRGDMTYVEQVGDEIRSQKAAHDSCQAYWASKMTPHPGIEIMVLTATVVKVMSDDEVEKLTFLKQRYRLPV